MTTGSQRFKACWEITWPGLSSKAAWKCQKVSTWVSWNNVINVLLHYDSTQINLQTTSFVILYESTTKFTSRENITIAFYWINIPATEQISKHLAREKEVSKAERVTGCSLGAPYKWNGCLFKNWWEGGRFWEGFSSCLCKGFV